MVSAAGRERPASSPDSSDGSPSLPLAELRGRLAAARVALENAKAKTEAVRTRRAEVQGRIAGTSSMHFISPCALRSLFLTSSLVLVALCEAELTSELQSLRDAADVAAD